MLWEEGQPVTISYTELINYTALILMTFTASFAAFFLKKSTNAGSITSIVKSKFLYIGGFLYIGAAALNIWLFQREMDYSVVVPLGSLNYIWTMFIARIFLKEKINMAKIIGVLLIFSGVICVAL